MGAVKSESIALFCLTPGGVVLTKRLATMLPVTCFTSEKLLEEGFIPFKNSFANTAREASTNYSALIFIGTTGTTARVPAPLVNGKFCDPAVVVIDEHAQHIVSLLSGHAGGASALAHYLAGMLGANPVITTAMGVNDMAALDTLAFQLNTRMSGFRSAVKIVNQMLVNNERVDLWWGGELAQGVSHRNRHGFITVTDLSQLPEPDALVCITLRTSLLDLPVPHWKLVPRRVVTGTGCRRGTPFPLLAALFARRLEAQQLDPLVLKAAGNITLKKGERGLIQLASYCHVSFETFTADTLHEYKHRFPASSFVHETVDTGSASSPAVWLLNHGELLGGTLREQGVAITLGASHWCQA